MTSDNTRTSLKAIFTVTLLTLCSLTVSGCTNTSSTSRPDSNSSKAGNPLYPMMSAKQCADVGGELVGDIGDGRIHRPDYLCNNGTAPIGTIKDQDEPVMTEGAVCCGP